MNDSDNKTSSADISGVYLYEGHRVKVSVIEDKVVAVTEDGVKLAVLDVLREGVKVEG